MDDSLQPNMGDITMENDEEDMEMEDAEAPIMINKIVKKVQKKKGKKALTSVKSPEQTQEGADEDENQAVDLDSI